MIRLYTPTPLHVGETITLSEAAHHYLCRVMRLGAGEILNLFDNQTGTYQVHILEVTRKHTRLSVDHFIKELDVITPPITLVFALVKKNALDMIIQKATELGVTALQPMITQHTVTRTWDPKRIQAQIIEAAEQTERNTLPIVHPLLPLPSILDQRKTGQGGHLLVGDERRRAPNITRVLADLPRFSEYSLMVGPEGGFTEEELDRIIASDHCSAIAMGPRILRADTAAIAALSVCRATLGDW